MQDAQAFIAREGGSIARFDQITPALVGRVKHAAQDMAMPH
jgi:nitrous oxide reductase accessory protein NosL